MQPLWSVGLALGMASIPSDHQALIDAPLLDLAEPGFRLTALDYRRLEQARENFGRRMAMLHTKYDLLITPQLSIGVRSGPQIGIQGGPPRFAFRTISVRPVGAGRGCGDGASAGLVHLRTDSSVET